MGHRAKFHCSSNGMRMHTGYVEMYQTFIYPKLSSCFYIHTVSQAVVSTRND